MTRADQLRQALDIIDAERAHEQISGYVTEESPIVDAARCWLRLQEGGAIIIERDKDGNWPEWAILCCPDNDTEILDDLALASAQENQP